MGALKHASWSQLTVLCRQNLFIRKTYHLRFATGELDYWPWTIVPNMTELEHNLCFRESTCRWVALVAAVGKQVSWRTRH